MKKHIELQEWVLHNIPVKVTIYHEKRYSCRVSIVKNGVNVRLPISLSELEKIQRLESFKAWTSAKLLKGAANASKKYANGSILQLTPKTYYISIIPVAGLKASAKLKDNLISIQLPFAADEAVQQEVIKKLLIKITAKDNLEWLKTRIQNLNDLHFKKIVKKIKIKYNHSNWGSCSSKANINISLRLLFAPLEVIDYVCIHELAHLIEPNHSFKFWNLVKTAMPGFEEQEKWLKQNGSMCNF